MTHRGMFCDLLWRVLLSDSGHAVTEWDRRRTHSPGPLPQTRVPFPSGASVRHFTSLQPHRDASGTDWSARVQMRAWETC